MKKITKRSARKEHLTREQQADRYCPLDTAVKDLLSELGIDVKCLEVMARGYSPDYPGSIDLGTNGKQENPKVKVQLSRIVARKLLSTLELDYQN